MKVFTTLVICFILASQLPAQVAGQKIHAIPYPLEVYNHPVSYEIKDDIITFSSEGKTNLFNNPNGKSKVNNAPMLLFNPKGDFTLTAKAAGNLKAVYDVAALVIYQDEDRWAKLCYEKSVLGEPTIVSVVTRGFSDDCNSEPTGSSAYLSIVKKGNEFSFFYSPDNVNWKMIRHFHLDTDNNLKAGFAVHGSRGNGFTGIFTDIKYRDEALNDMRELN